MKVHFRLDHPRVQHHTPLSAASSWTSLRILTLFNRYRWLWNHFGSDRRNRCRSGRFSRNSTRPATNTRPDERLRVFILVDAPHVRCEMVLLAEGFLAKFANKGFLARVDAHVLLVRAGRGEPLLADLALVALFACV